MGGTDIGGIFALTTAKSVAGVIFTWTKIETETERDLEVCCEAQIGKIQLRKTQSKFQTS